MGSEPCLPIGEAFGPAVVPVKDVNIACRIEYDTWKALDQIRLERSVQNKQTLSLSDIIREALDDYVGDTWNSNQ